MEVFYDIVVTGGGLAGVCASIAAGRCGAKVALVQDRPLLGGNASGELRIHTAGADCSGSAIARYVRESGIIAEILLENLYRNHANSPAILSQILREAVQAEPSVDLYMNTCAISVEMNDDSMIKSIEAVQYGTEKNYVFRGKIFIDCTGDGFIASKSGACFRVGRESRDEFNENLAPEKPDGKTLPSCVQFYLKDMGKPVSFEAPKWAYKYETKTKLPFRDLNEWKFAGLYGGFWWLSAGGDKSTIADNEEIYQELLKVLMGLWDHMKNCGNHGTENFALDWISPFPGKRESRRFEGDYWLKEADVLNGQIFDDRIAYGGWPIDVHVPEGVFSKERPNLHVPLARPYTIPLRCLYSKQISNLMFAGRDASYTHVGLGSPRVMATCAVTGQAAGVAAALALNKQKTPKRIQSEDIKDVQQHLLKQGAYIPLCSNDSVDDIAKQAKVEASSEIILSIDENHEDKYSFENRLFQLFPVSANKIDKLSILVETNKCMEFTAGIRKADDIWDFSSGNDLAKTTKSSNGNGKEWIDFEFKLKDIDPGLYWMWVACTDKEANWLGKSVGPVGLVRGRFEAVECQLPELAPAYQTMPGVFIFTLSPRSHPYAPYNVINGVARPAKWTNLWISKPIGKQPEWLELSWSQSRCITEVHLTFDAQLDSNVVWPKPLGVLGCKVLPTIIKNYEIKAKISGKWKPLICIDNNYQYRQIHRFKAVETEALRVYVYETNGVKEARIFEVRVY